MKLLCRHALAPACVVMHWLLPVPSCTGSCMLPIVMGCLRAVFRVTVFFPVLWSSNHRTVAGGFLACRETLHAPPVGWLPPPVGWLPCPLTRESWRRSGDCWVRWVRVAQKFSGLGSTLIFHWLDMNLFELFFLLDFDSFFTTVTEILTHLFLKFNLKFHPFLILLFSSLLWVITQLPASDSYKLGLPDSTTQRLPTPRFCDLPTPQSWDLPTPQPRDLSTPRPWDLPTPQPWDLSTRSPGTCREILHSPINIELVRLLLLYLWCPVLQYM